MDNRFTHDSRAANQYGTSVFWNGNGLSSTGIRTEGKKYGNKKLPTWFQLSFCLHFTPTQSIYWSGHSGVAFLLITSWLKWLKHNSHYHKNNKPHDLIQLGCAPVRPITFDTGGSHVLETGSWIKQAMWLVKFPVCLGQLCISANENE